MGIRIWLMQNVLQYFDFVRYTVPFVCSAFGYIIGAELTQLIDIYTNDPVPWRWALRVRALHATLFVYIHVC